MSKRYEKRLAEYAKLREEHPDEPLRFFAEHFGVHTGTVSRWNKALKKQTIKEEALDELEERLRKEYEAKMQAILDEKEAEREERERKKREEERRKSENRRDHFKRIWKNCARETIVTTQDETITWQGFTVKVKAGVPTEVPEVAAGVWRDAQKARGHAAKLIKGLSQQFIGNR